MGERLRYFLWELELEPEPAKKNPEPVKNRPATTEFIVVDPFESVTFCPSQLERNGSKPSTSKGFCYFDAQKIKNFFSQKVTQIF